MTWRNRRTDAKPNRNRPQPLPGRQPGRRAVAGLAAFSLLAAAAALVVAAGTAAAQSDSGSQSGSGSGSNFSVGFDAIQLDSPGGGGGGGSGKRLGFGSGGPGGGGAKQHGMDFGDVRERCLADEAFRRRNATACKHLLV